ELLTALKAHAVLQRVFRVEPVHGTRWVAAGVIPDPDVMAVGEEDHRPLAMHLLQAIGVLLGLLLANTGIDRRLLGFDNGERLAVVIPQHIVAIAFGAGRRLMQDLDLLADRLVAGYASRNVPTCHPQVAVD